MSDFYYDDKSNAKNIPSTSSRDILAAVTSTVSLSLSFSLSFSFFGRAPVNGVTGRWFFLVKNNLFLFGYCLWWLIFLPYFLWFFVGLLIVGVFLFLYLFLVLWKSILLPLSVDCFAITIIIVFVVIVIINLFSIIITIFNIIQIIIIVNCNHSSVVVILILIIIVVIIVILLYLSSLTTIKIIITVYLSLLPYFFISRITHSTFQRGFTV